MSHNYYKLLEDEQVKVLSAELDDTLSSVNAAYNSFSDALIAAVDILPRPRYAELESIYVRLHDLRKELESFPIEE